jgi:hypothetical protein
MMSMALKDLCCAYCRKIAETHSQAIHHCLSEHPTQKVAFIVETRQGQSIKYKKRTFNICGKDITSDSVNYNDITGKIEINSPIKTGACEQIYLLFFLQ